MSKIYAHRGFSSMEPENSIEAIIEATKYDYIDGIEIDIRMTKDEEFVLIHNKNIDLVSNGVGNVCDYTLEELKKLDFHINTLDYRTKYLKSFINKDGHTIRKKLRRNRKQTFKIVTLEEVLEVIQNKILLIEIKYIVGDKFNFEKFLKIISKYKNKKILIQSFSKTIIKKLKGLNKNLDLGILIDNTQVQEKLAMKTNFISIRDKSIDNNILVNELYKKKEVNVWTVNYYRDLKKLVSKVDGKINSLNIITDEPDLIYKYLNLLNKKK